MKPKSKTSKNHTKNLQKIGFVYVEIRRKTAHAKNGKTTHLHGSQRSSHLKIEKNEPILLIKRFIKIIERLQSKNILIGKR